MTRSLHVRNIEDDVVQRLKARAVRHGRSAEAEHREILRQVLSADVEPSFGELAAQLRAMSASRTHTPSEDLQHEGRADR